MLKLPKKIDYASSGVDIDAGIRAVDLMKKHVKKTWGPEVLADLGGFSGLFAPDMGGLKEPVLVAGTDGVGTKLKIAFLMDRHETIGIDAVAMCVNDILVCGARPMFFLDYIALGKMIPEKAASIVEGIAEGCERAGCALIGGETAEMPGMYKEGEYDIAGFAVGIVDRTKIIDGSEIKPGSRLIGLPSTGLHSNGFSLVRKILFEIHGFEVEDYVPELAVPLGEELLKPTGIYVSTVERLKDFHIQGMSHITGGGIYDNLARILPRNCNAVVDKNSWEIPTVFQWLQDLGKIEDREMYRTFNNGIGLILAVDAGDTEGIINTLGRYGQKAFAIGEIIPGDGKVDIV
ncbi:MAG: phosphoribosylformylglycinamidine cyclo-ligase [Clostridia bacterium]|nr:phosphoribosylformylglycinamidine cyclo-ligase [Clostridia bacterium]